MSTNEIATIFNHDDFGEVRVLMIDEEPWFAGTDVANCLGYSNTRDAVKRLVKDNQKKHLNREEISRSLSPTPNEWGI